MFNSEERTNRTGKRTAVISANRIYATTYRVEMYQRGTFVVRSYERTTKSLKAARQIAKDWCRA